MADELKKRQRRIPFTPEEVEQLRIIKKMREYRKLIDFKRTFTYKILNLFNLFCFFIYLELLFCYLGPCHYQAYYSWKTIAEYGDSYTKKMQPIISVLKVTGVNKKVYQFVINDFISLPPQKMRFIVGKDFLLQKELKGSFAGFVGTYRLFSASPVLFLCMFIGSISFMSFVFDLNEHTHSLNALSVMNMLTLLGIILL